MGYHQHVVISTTLSAETLTRSLQSAQNHWPFLRNPRRHDIYFDRLLLAPPELTGYLFENNEEEEEAAAEQCFLLSTELPNWSKDFPDAIFALIEADCFGGNCVYSGFVCQAGNILERAGPSSNAHVKLLELVGVFPEGMFIPFQRVFFEGRCSGLRNSFNREG